MKCPSCGGDIVNGVCSDCGYKMPVPMKGKGKKKMPTKLLKKGEKASVAARFLKKKKK